MLLLSNEHNDNLMYEYTENLVSYPKLHTQISRCLLQPYYRHYSVDNAETLTIAHSCGSFFSLCRKKPINYCLWLVIANASECLFIICASTIIENARQNCNLAAIFPIHFLNYVRKRCNRITFERDAKTILRAHGCYKHIARAADYATILF